MQYTVQVEVHPMLKRLGQGAESEQGWGQYAYRRLMIWLGCPFNFRNSGGCLSSFMVDMVDEHSHDNTAVFFS